MSRLQEQTSPTDRPGFYRYIEARFIALTAVTAILAACGSGEPWAGSAGEVRIQQAPIAATTGQPLAIDVDEDGKELILIDASDSFDPDGSVVSYNWSEGLTELGREPTLELELDVGDHVFMLTVTDDDGLIDLLPVVARVVAPFEGEPNSPAIEVWTSTRLVLDGGPAQRWVSVPGNTSDPDGVAAVRFQLNDGPIRGAPLGPDDRRLVRAGDFTVEIARSELSVGTNVLLIESVDNNGLVSTAAVQIETEDQPAAVLPARVEWAEAEEVGGTAVEPVDGRWDFTDRATVPLGDAGYNRLLAVGSVEWADYEVQTTIRLSEIRQQTDMSPLSGSPAFGLALRWQGHSEPATPTGLGITADRAVEDFPSAGATFLARWQPGLERFIPELQNHRGLAVDFESANQLDGSRDYAVRMQVQTVIGGSYYRAKIWPQGDPEPTGWSVELATGQEDLQPESGSIALIAHELSASFGDVVIGPIPVGDRVESSVTDLEAQNDGTPTGA